MLKINTVKINLLASDIAYNIQQQFYKGENAVISMPIRKYYREQIFSRNGAENPN